MNGPEFLIPIAFFVAITTIVRSILKFRERKLEMDSLSLGNGRESAARLERMEQAIDAMAVEIERISETQRFTTRLLTERGGDAQRSAAELEYISQHARR
ncbi:MAG: hypothetical protein ACT4P7_23000 [Gemmatimonadaceae bacterium]